MAVAGPTRAMHSTTISSPAHSSAVPGVETSVETGGRQPPPVAITAAAIGEAHARLRGIVRETPCVEAPVLGAEAGVRLFLKRDDLQVTGSFKERGAAHALSRLTPEERLRGIVAASAGNHALGLAQHGPRFGVGVTLVMPHTATRVKIERCRELGARVVLVGATYAEAESHARRVAAESGARFVHPFDDPAVIAGQGTLGLELLAQVPQVDAVIVPVGGGGLLAGVATAVKAARPDVRIVAAEPAAAPKFAAACAHGTPTPIVVGATFADGLAVTQLGRNTFANTRGRVDAGVVVTEAEIAYAMLRLFEVERLVVEGSGAVALAALLSGRVAGVRGKTVVVPICGANVDASTFARALHLAVA